MMAASGKANNEDMTDFRNFSYYRSPRVLDRGQPADHGTVDLFKIGR